MKAYVIGNGASLVPQLLDGLIGERTYAVNRIWKIFPYTAWRPTDYVRCETRYERDAVKQDLYEMSMVGCRMWLHRGFMGLENRAAHDRTTFEWFQTCTGERHDWHLPEICMYGSVVHVAMQIAILQGATEIDVLGCDLGTPAHFYGKEGSAVDETLIDAHAIAQKCSPIPINWLRQVT